MYTRTCTCTALLASASTEQWAIESTLIYTGVHLVKSPRGRAKARRKTFWGGMCIVNSIPEGGGGGGG